MIGIGGMEGTGGMGGLGGLSNDEGGGCEGAYPRIESCPIDMVIDSLELCAMLARILSYRRLNRLSLSSFFLSFNFDIDLNFPRRLLTLDDELPPRLSVLFPVPRRGGM
jgi:hypothetical protein